jgi:hypothetical protein
MSALVGPELGVARHLRFATPAGVAPEDCRGLSSKAADGMSALVGGSWGWSGILGLLHPPVRRPTIAFHGLRYAAGAPPEDCSPAAFLLRPPVRRPEIAADCG